MLFSQQFRGQAWFLDISMCSRFIIKIQIVAMRGICWQQYPLAESLNFQHIFYQFREWHSVKAQVAIAMEYKIGVLR